MDSKHGFDEPVQVASGIESVQVEIESIRVPVQLQELIQIKM
jgi:hypothetical protein